VLSANLTALAFDRQREALRQDIANFAQKTPLALASYHRNLALATTTITIEQLANVIEKVTLKDLTAYQKALPPEALLEAFLIGNLDTADAEKIVESVRGVIPNPRILPADQIPLRKVKQLPPGKRFLEQYPVRNLDETNSACDIYFQVGMDEGDNWLLLGLLSTIIDTPFYEELRTKQQLGYIVSSGVTESESVRGILFVVQSSVLPPPQVEERILTFLTNWRGELAKISETELDSFREAFATQATDIDKRLGEQAGRLWSEILRRRYEYGRPWRTARRVRKVTREQLLNFYDRFIMPSSQEGSRLVTHLFAKQVAPSNFAVDELPSQFYPAPTEQPLPAAAVRSSVLAA